MTHAGEGDARVGTWFIKPTPPSIFGQLHAVWRYRHLFWLFTTRAFFDLYRNAILGSFWLFIRPLMIAVPAVFIVGNVFGVSVSPVPLPLFILVSLACWLLFRRSLQWVTKSMNKNRHILRRLYVPALLLLLASISPALIEFLVVMTVVAAAAIYFGPVEGVYYVTFGWSNLAVIPAIALCLLLAIAIGCFTSILNALARDTWLTMRYVMSGWMLATPIVYPIDVIPEAYHWIVYLNPMAPIVELFRWGILGIGTVSWQYVGLATAETLLLLMLGLWFFGKQQNRLFDHI